MTTTNNENKKEKKPLIRSLKGIVTSDAMDKTIVVKVERAKKYPKYQKRYKVSKKYKVHDENNDFKVGDNVEFVACRPLSKDKKWRVIKNK